MLPASLSCPPLAGCPITDCSPSPFPLPPPVQPKKKKKHLAYNNLVKIENNDNNLVKIESKRLFKGKDKNHPSFFFSSQKHITPKKKKGISPKIPHPYLTKNKKPFNRFRS